MDSIVRIVIVDDHHIFRTGLSMILNGINNFKVVGEASSGKQLTDLLKSQTTDVIFMDIRLPDTDGITLTKEIRKKYPETKIIALTMFGEIDYFNKMIDAGAHGFLLKRAENQELEDAIQTVMEGKYYVVKEFANSIDLKDKETPETTDVGLSKREKEVLCLICEGYSTSEIADKLFLSAYTVEGHRRNLMNKTGAKNTATLVRFAVTNNIIDL